MLFRGQPLCGWTPTFATTALPLTYHVNRVQRNKQADKRAGEVERVLNRVHREPGPRPRVVGLVVDGVHPLVQQLARVTPVVKRAEAASS